MSRGCHFLPIIPQGNKRLLHTILTNRQIIDKTVREQAQTMIKSIKDLLIYFSVTNRQSLDFY